MNFPLSFHQTFAPEKEATAQLVQFAFNYSDKYFTKEEISSLTTIPTGEKSGKVIPHIYYANSMGLIEFEKDNSKFKISLTPLGELVSKEDPYLIETLTHLLCHYNLASLDSKALLWSFIFNQLIKNQGLLIKNDSIKKAVNRNFKVSSVNITPFRTCYIEERCLGNLNLLEIGIDEFIFKEHKIDRTLRYLYGYLLLTKWESLMPDQSEITYNILINGLGFGGPFIWDDNNLNEVLDILQEERIIVINRQLFPVTYIKQVTSESLLNKIYSLLI